MTHTEQINPNEQLREATRKYLGAPLPEELDKAFNRELSAERSIQQAKREGRQLTISDVLNLVADFFGSRAKAAEEAEEGPPAGHHTSEFMFGTSDPANIASEIDRRIIEYRNFSTVCHSLSTLASEAPLSADEVAAHRRNLTHTAELLAEARRNFAANADESIPQPQFVQRMNATCASGLLFAEIQFSRFSEFHPGPGR